MKIMIASDIHGSAYYCKLMLDAFSAEKADKLLLLGDILYHGPRNDLPRDYDPRSVISQLNAISDKIVCVRGNCDSEVDGMVLNFPISADSAMLFLGDRTVFATHGHIYNEQNLPKLAKGDILLHGHTHIPVAADRGSYIFLNPGSVSIPKENSPHSCIILSDNTFRWLDLANMSSYMEF